MSRSNTAVAVQQDSKPEGRSIAKAVAHRYGMEPRAFVEALRSTWPADVQQKITDHQIAAFLVICDQYKLNPLTKEIYAFPSKGGAIVPMLGIDGWISIANNHPEFDGQEWKDLVENGKLVAVECTIWRKDRSRPTTVREYLSECQRGTEPWKLTPARMLRHRAFMQCARYAFGFSGLAVEGDIIDGEVLEIVPQAGDVVGQSVPSARELALQREDDEIRASAERAAIAREAKEQNQRPPESEQSGDPSAGDLPGIDKAEDESGAAPSEEDEETEQQADEGGAEDPRWRVVDQLISTLKGANTAEALWEAKKAIANDWRALAAEMQDEVSREATRIWIALLSDMDDSQAANWICRSIEVAKTPEALNAAVQDVSAVIVGMPAELQKLIEVSKATKLSSMKGGK